MKLILPLVIRIQKYYRVLRRRVRIAIKRIREQYHFIIIHTIITSFILNRSKMLDFLIKDRKCLIHNGN